ncbi:MAG: amidase family protein [Candidatus Auribacterota bacterium]|nr:amidase family protein [Candidatus Auribacterota bacterium]
MQTKLYSYIDPSLSSTNIGPLADITVLLQPNMSVRGWPTEAGSAALENYLALEDATAVGRLRNDGATIIGSGRMAELGLGLAGDTTAEILAGDKCDLALVTDTMGEARLSALSAGRPGFKPSYGIISRSGLIGLVPSMECCGIAAGTTERIMAVLESLSGEDERDPSMRRGVGLDFTREGEASDSAVPVGIIREWIDDLPPRKKEAFNTSLSRLEKSGGRIEEVSLPDFDLFRPVHNIIGAVEASSAAGKYDSVRYGHRAADTENWNEMYLKSRAESFGPTVKSYLFQGAYFQFEDFTAFTNACRVRRRLCRELEKLFEKVDLLAGPARRLDTDAAAGTVEEIYEAFAHTLPANVAGLPSICIPGSEAGSSTDPGLQLLGPPLSDPRLISFAGRIG